MADELLWSHLSQTCRRMCKRLGRRKVLYTPHLSLLRHFTRTKSRRTFFVAVPLMRTIVTLVETTAQTFAPRASILESLCSKLSCHLLLALLAIHIVAVAGRACNHILSHIRAPMARCALSSGVIQILASRPITLLHNSHARVYVHFCASLRGYRATIS